MGRTVSLKGAAAKQMIESMMGKPAETTEDKLERVLTHIEAGLKERTANGRVSAKAILIVLMSEGLDAASASVTR